MIPHIAGDPEWNYDMSTCKAGTKCLLLTFNGICITGAISSDNREAYAAWSPMPKRNKELENSLGIIMNVQRPAHNNR